MALQWYAIAAFLYAEIGLGLLLSIGFISNVRWQRIFTSHVLSLIAYHGSFFFNSFVLVLLLFFVDSIRNTYNLSKIDMSRIDLHHNPQAEVLARKKLFRAQRNLYITGFALFMLIILKRLAALVSQQAQLEASNEAVVKQAQGASEQARKLFLENENLQKDSGSKSRARTHEAEEVKELLEMIDTLKEDLNETTSKLETAEIDLAATKAQAEGLHTEYDRVLDLNYKLEKKVAIMGDNVNLDCHDDKKDD